MTPTKRQHGFVVDIGIDALLIVAVPQDTPSISSVFDLPRQQHHGDVCPESTTPRYANVYTRSRRVACVRESSRTRPTKTTTWVFRTGLQSTRRERKKARGKKQDTSMRLGRTGRYMRWRRIWRSSPAQNKTQRHKTHKMCVPFACGRAAAQAAL